MQKKTKLTSHRMLFASETMTSRKKEKAEEAEQERNKQGSTAASSRYRSDRTVFAASDQIFCFFSCFFFSLSRDLLFLSPQCHISLCLSLLLGIFSPPFLAISSLFLSCFIFLSVLLPCLSDSPCSSFGSSIFLSSDSFLSIFPPASFLICNLSSASPPHMQSKQRGLVCFACMHFFLSLFPSFLFSSSLFCPIPFSPHLQLERRTWQTEQKRKKRNLIIF